MEDTTRLVKVPLRLVFSLRLCSAKHFCAHLGVSLVLTRRRDEPNGGVASGRKANSRGGEGQGQELHGSRKCR